MADRSVVEYFKEREGYRCGYCGNTDTNYSNGMWAHKMACEDYQDLIDRGWRRSGQYCYKPIMNIMCCPSYTIKSGKRCYKPVNRKICCPRYTIKCEALHYKSSKSQKKVLKEMTNYLTTAESRKCGNERMNEKKKERSETSSEVSSADMGETNSSTRGKTIKKQTCLGVGADADKPPCRKAKDLRMERKQQKLSARGIQPDTTQTPKPSKRNVEKSLEDLLLEHMHLSNPAHKLEIKIVHADMSSEEFTKTFNESHNIYQKYQMAIHNDTLDNCTKKQFQRFLVDSPLAHYQGPGAPSLGYGTFHQQYYIDGVLIAIGVLDILPRCVSSVYLYYDPAYGFLSPGIYSAQREIYLTQQLHKEAANIEYYYMGFYIHSCPKMKYKGNYHPSYLACPETYNWVAIEECRPKLDANKYSRLDANSPIPPSTDISKVLILHQRQAMPFQIYVIIKSSFQDGEDGDGEDGDIGIDTEMIQEYANLVGPEVASRMLLYRS